MSTRKNSKVIKAKKGSIKNLEKKIEEKEKFVLEKTVVLQKNIKLKKEERMLNKVEKYVDKTREKTSQEMIERKRKRPIKNYQEWDLEVMISRVSVESKPKEKTKEISKRIVNIIYIIILLVIIIFTVKYFFVWNVPQIS